MKHPDNRLFTPIYIKSEKDMAWPEHEKAFYLLSGTGLYMCRNHPFFRSCAPVRNWPSELAAHASSLHVNYPRVPRRLFELVVGFFDRIGQLHGSEAGILLAWDQPAKRVRLVVPQQTATVSRGWSGRVYPIGLHYETPADLPANWVLFGDIHSHVDESAYASGTDKHDEAHRPGLHIVIGRINDDPPDIHIEAVVDGTRFRLRTEEVIEGYAKRRLKVPQAWLDKVKVEPPNDPSPPAGKGGWGHWDKGYYYGGSSANGYGSSYARDPYPRKDDYGPRQGDKHGH